ncbi:MAG: hypothetical protein GVY27_13640, partial [Deinococcus-Thermus bacterium]|nr:hypothetical protein [Deinococcota bacterium]
PAYTAREEVVVPGVDAPIGIEWLPGNDDIMLIAEKGGAIRVYDTASETFLPDLLEIRDEVNNAADRGLIDFVLHPEFPTTPKIYVTYTVDPPGVAGNTGNDGPDGGGNRFNWLVTYDVDLSSGSPVAVPESKEILVGAAGQTLDDIQGRGALDYTRPDFDDVDTYPASDIDLATGEVRQDFWKMDSRSHVGGGLTFGPDGALYVAVGDGTSFNYDDERTITVQDTDALAGKILRIDPETRQSVLHRRPGRQRVEGLAARPAQPLPHRLRRRRRALHLEHRLVLLGGDQQRRPRRQLRLAAVRGWRQRRPPARAGLRRSGAAPGPLRRLRGRRPGHHPALSRLLAHRGCHGDRDRRPGRCVVGLSGRRLPGRHPGRLLLPRHRRFVRDLLGRHRRPGQRA